MMQSILSAAGWVTGFAAALAVLWKVLAWSRNVVSGLRCQLRTDMLRVYYRNRDSKTIRQYELENFLENYKAYRALGGNSFIVKVQEEVCGWKVIS